jgi:hypothetical protein
MKRIISALFLLGTLSVHAQNIKVTAIKALDQDFSSYRTFYWAGQVDEQLDLNSFFLNDLVLKADIRDAVHGELEALGYKLNATNPDLIINFRVFDRPTTLHGLDGYERNYWGTNEYFAGADSTSFDVEAGTIIISIVDRREQNLVWQGFATGLLKEGEFNKNDGNIREAVKLIFDEYGHRVYEYTKR